MSPDLLATLIRLAEIISEQVAGCGSEWVAGLISESLAGNVGIRSLGHFSYFSKVLMSCMLYRYLLQGWR